MPSVARPLSSRLTPGSSQDRSYYLIPVDSAGSELTDTWHETIDEAMTQAEWELQVARADWERMPD